MKPILLNLNLTDYKPKGEESEQVAPQNGWKFYA